MTVIELDAIGGWTPEVAARPRPVRTLGVVGVLLAVLAVLTGPPPIPPRPLPLAWEDRTYNGFFWTGPHGIYSIEPAPAGHPDGAGLTLVARDPDSGTPQWTADLPGPVAAGYVRGWESLVSRFPPTPDLGAATLVLDSRSGKVIRAYPTAAMPLAYIGDDVAVLIDRDPAAGPPPEVVALDPDDTGLSQPYLITAIDLRTGRVRWHRPIAPGWLWSLPAVHPGAEGITGLPTGQPWMVLSNLAGQIQVLDLGTGTTTANVDVGPLGPEGYVTALATAVLVRHGIRAEVTMQLLDPRTLTAEQTLHPPARYAMPVECAARLCLESDRTVFGLDTTGGGLVWRLDGTHPRSAVPGSGHLVPELGEPLVLVDPGSGLRSGAVAQSWRVADPATSGRQVVVARSLTPTSVQIAVVDTLTGAIDELGPLAPIYTLPQCQIRPDGAGHTLVACGDGPSVRVWRTR